MGNIVKQYWLHIIIAVLVVIAGVRVYNTFFTAEPTAQATLSSSVETFSLSDIRAGKIETSCLAQAVDDAAVVAEYSGKVSQVYVKDGQEVERGDKLFALENIAQRVSVQNARVSLRSAELALSELLADNDLSNQSSLLVQTQNQQEQNVVRAKNALYNNDLKAYPEEDPNEVRRNAPIVEGNYTCEAQGEYVVEVYASSSESGASFRFGGLENGRESVSTTAFGTNLGNCGLELRFPEIFDKKETWVIPVPNTQSATYTQVRTAYENAVSGKDITLNNIQASPQRIAQERARVTQARLQLESANDALAKTVVKAPVSGILSSFEVSVGDFASPSVNMGRVKSIGNLEIVANVSSDESLYLDANATATVDGQDVAIENILPTADSQTRRTKVVLAAPENVELIEGNEYVCALPRTTELSIAGPQGNGVIVPLSAISVIGVDTYVFTIIDGLAQRVSVTTGALLGDNVVIYGADTDIIIRDARGIRDQQQVVVKES